MFLPLLPCVEDVAFCKLKSLRANRLTLLQKFKTPFSFKQAKVANLLHIVCRFSHTIHKPNRRNFFVLQTKGLKTVAFVLALITLSALLFVLVSPSANAAVVKVGSTGTIVRTIQTKLKRWGYYTGNVDGIFGAKTKAAVQYFQRKNGLTADGIVGNATAKAMGVTLSGTTSAGGSTGAGSLSNSDLYLLSCCVYGEARGESYTGKVAVAAVVLNRVRSSKFPNSISGVIYQQGAFTCVSDGQINLGTNDECTRAAQDALNGWDPTGGAIYYFNPATATSKWIWSRPQLVTIGKHIFCS